MGHSFSKTDEQLAPSMARVALVTNKYPAVIFTKTLSECSIPTEDLLKKMCKKGALKVMFLRGGKEGWEFQEALARMSNGQRTVPNVWIGGHYIGNAEDVDELNSRGMLKPLLEKSGAM
mmetsp:Transcript_20526/g.50236  ORF Transcript_20526/g.50236 Transcript_20526/m.50236 type:complete len:119 (+) Transcript_20526:226-582(+)